MPTTFYVRPQTFLTANFQLYLGATYERGPTSTSFTVNTVAGATFIPIADYITPPLEPFTLAGSISANLRGSESNAQANATLAVRILRFNAVDNTTTTVTLLSSATELGTTEAARTMSATPPSTAISAGDRIQFTVAAVNVGSMGGGRTVTFNFNGPTAGASGDSFITFTETIKFRNRAVVFG